MGLETFTFISSLNENNPVGASDPKSQGDDHLRGIKHTILVTFPNITGAVNATQVQLNYSADLTGVTGTGNMVRSADPTLTGTVTAATINATTLTGAGSGITALNASNLASGTIPDARFPATLPAASGANLTSLNASNLSSGTVADARLPTTQGGKVFTSNIEIQHAQTAGYSTSAVYVASNVPAYGWRENDAGSNEKGWDMIAQGGHHFFRLDTDTPAAAVNLWDVTRSAATPLSMNMLPTAGVFQYGGKEVGYKGGEQNNQNAGYNFAKSDCGRVVAAATGGNFGLLTGIFSAGDIITFTNTTGGNCGIIQGSGVTIRKMGQPGVTGNVTVSDYGVATIYAQTGAVFLVGGPGCT